MVSVPISIQKFVRYKQKKNTLLNIQETSLSCNNVFKSLNPAIDCPWFMVGSNPGSGGGGNFLI